MQIYIFPFVLDYLVEIKCASLKKIGRNVKIFVVGFLSGRRENTLIMK